jgi:hypothetical protein
VTSIAPALVSAALLAGYGGVLPIEGQFGNREGCRFYLTGEVQGPIMLMTPDTLSSPEAQCDFRALAATGAGSFTIDAVCSGKADFSMSPDRVVVTDGGAAGWFVTIDGLPELGPFIPCINFSGEERA